MDTDKQTLGVLRAFADILAAGSAAQTPVLLGMFPGLVAACRSASDAVYEDVVDTLELVAGRPEFRDVMLKERVPEFLVRGGRGGRAGWQVVGDDRGRCREEGPDLPRALALAELLLHPHSAPHSLCVQRDMRPVLEDYGADDALAKLDRTLAALNGSSSSSSSSNSSAAAKDTAAAPAAAKRAVATLQVTMDNLLGVRAVEDRYIRAMLGVDGVTSVTLDRKRDVGLVYHHAGDDAQALKAQLYEIIQVRELPAATVPWA